MDPAQALAAALDPVRLATAAGLTPDSWQRAALRSVAPRALWNVSRQAGKSTIAAVLAVHEVVYHAGALVLLVSPSERQSKEIFAKALQVYQAAGQPAPADSETRLWLELHNGSRLVALPGTETTVRGFSRPSLIVVDEASRCPDDLYFALLPMLAVSKGRLLCLSTPAGQRGFFFEQWTAGGDAWERVEVPADRCPRIDPDWLEEQRRTMPRAWFEQEFLCRFTQVDDAVFTYDDVQGIVRDDVDPFFPELLTPSPSTPLTPSAGGAAW